MAAAFNVVSGLSDHTLGTATSVAAVALGASIIEKHFTISRSEGGPDAAFSLEPNEFKALCQDSFYSWQSIGQVSYDRANAELKSNTFRRSLYIIDDVKAGGLLTTKNVKSIRPGFGLPPSNLEKILGRRANCDIERGTALAWHLVD